MKAPLLLAALAAIANVAHGMCVDGLQQRPLPRCVSCHTTNAAADPPSTAPTPRLGTPSPWLGVAARGVVLGAQVAPTLISIAGSKPPPKTSLMQSALQHSVLVRTLSFGHGMEPSPLWTIAKGCAKLAETTPLQLP